jgi:hypothetical protein
MRQQAGQEAQEQRNERQRRRHTGGGGVMRGYMTNSRGGQEATAPEKRRGTNRGSGMTRGGQVKAAPDRRRWHDKKLRWQRTRRINTTASQVRREA